MAEQEFRGHTAPAVRILKNMVPKVERYLDWVYSPSCKKETIRKDITIALLNKIMPTKVEGELNVTAKFSHFITLELAELDTIERNIFKGVGSQSRITSDREGAVCS